MAKSVVKANHIQVNVTIPKVWKEQLEHLARIYSVEENRTISFTDLMRRSIQEKFQLKDEDANG